TGGSRCSSVRFTARVRRWRVAGRADRVRDHLERWIGRGDLDPPPRWTGHADRAALAIGEALRGARRDAASIACTPEIVEEERADDRRDGDAEDRARDPGDLRADEHRPQ